MRLKSPFDDVTERVGFFKFLTLKNNIIASIITLTPSDANFDAEL